MEHMAQENPSYSQPVAPEYTQAPPPFFYSSCYCAGEKKKPALGSRERHKIYFPRCSLYNPAEKVNRNPKRAIITSGHKKQRNARDP